MSDPQHTIDYLRAQLRTIAAVEPDLDGEDEDGQRRETLACLDTARRIAIRALRASLSP